MPATSHHVKCTDFKYPWCTHHHLSGLQGGRALFLLTRQSMPLRVEGSQACTPWRFTLITHPGESGSRPMMAHGLSHDRPVTHSPLGFKFHTIVDAFTEKSHKPRRAQSESGSSFTTRGWASATRASRLSGHSSGSGVTTGARAPLRLPGGFTLHRSQRVSIHRSWSQ